MKPALRLLSLIAVSAAAGLWGAIQYGTPPVEVRPVNLAVADSADALAATSTRAMAQVICDCLANAGGCTVDPRTGQTVGTVDAYAVSLPSYEVKFAACPSLEQVEHYLRRHAVDVAGNRSLYVGAWRDDATGQHYLDLSELISDRAVAEHRGRAQLQQCIYHLSTGQEIRLR